MVDATPQILQEQLKVQKEQNQKQDKANAEQSAERMKMNDILLKMKGVDEKRLDAIRDQVKVFEERELKLEEQKQAIESLGLKADQNIQLQKDFKQLELDRQAFDESQTQELGRRSVLERLQEKNTLVKNFKNLGDTFKKGFSNLGSRIGDFAKSTFSTIGTSALNIFKTTLFAGFIFALIQFFESEYWEKTKDFIVSIVEGGENSPLAKFKDTMSNLLTIFTSIAGLTAVGLILRLLGRKPVAGAKTGGGLLATLLTALGLGSLFGGKNDIGPIGPPAPNRPPIDKSKDKFFSIKNLKNLGKSLFTFAGLRAAITRFGLPGLIIGLFVLPALGAIADLVFTDEQKEKFKKDAEQFKKDTFDFLDKINIFKKDNELMQNVDNFFNVTLPSQFDEAVNSFNKNVIEPFKEDGLLKTLFPKLRKEMPPQLKEGKTDFIEDENKLERNRKELMKFFEDSLRPANLSNLESPIKDITNLSDDEKLKEIITGLDKVLDGELIDPNPDINIEKQFNNSYMFDQTDVINELKKEKAFREQLLQDLSNMMNAENKNQTVNVINAPSMSKVENSSSTTTVRPIVDMDLSIQRMLHARGYAN